MNNRRMKREEPKQSKLEMVGGFIQVLYPLILSAFTTPIILRMNWLWVGFLLGVVLIVLHETWWTCLLGLVNSMGILAMMIACLLAWIHELGKEEADKRSNLMPNSLGIGRVAVIQSITKFDSTLVK